MSIKILMPALSPTMTEGTLARWLVKEGDKVASGDIIAEIETDKATMEVEAADDGVVGRLLVAAGSENVAVNSVIAILLEEGETANDIEAVTDEPTPPENKPASEPEPAPEPTPEPAPESEIESAPAPEPAPAETPSPTPTPEPAPALSPGGERIFITPLARRLAAENNLDIALISGSGPHGRIIKTDIEQAINSGTAMQSAAAMGGVGVSHGGMSDAGDMRSSRSVKLSTMRKVIAERLTESKREIPHFYVTRECELDSLLSARLRLNAGADGAFKLSVNDFVIKAIAVALMRVPEANAEWCGDSIKLYDCANISVAVAIEGGLITPVIWGAERKGLVQISEEMRALAGLARAGKLVPEQYQGGSFSLSNLGMYGVDSFSAVINPPQACILAVGRGVEKAVVRDGELAIRTLMSVTLSVDHRAVDGAVGAQFLAAFTKIIEDPMELLL